MGKNNFQSAEDCDEEFPRSCAPALSFATFSIPIIIKCFVELKMSFAHRYYCFELVLHAP